MEIKYYRFMILQEASTLWCEIAPVIFIFALRTILMGHFEEKTPKVKHLAKIIGILFLVCLISYIFCRNAALGRLALIIIPVLIIHFWWLPKKVSNGWAAEPKNILTEINNRIDMTLKKPIDELDRL
jgi:hypothetical protein